MAPLAAEPDPALRRMERDALVACAVMAVLALAARGGRPDVALGVVGGGVLIGASYLVLKGTVSAIVGALTTAAAAGGIPAGATSGPAAEAPDVPEAVGTPGPEARAWRRAKRRQAVLLLIGFVVRYALLALGAYAMLMRLHLHPVGLVIGVSAPVVATAAEGVRSLRRASRPGQPQ